MKDIKMNLRQFLIDVCIRRYDELEKTLDGLTAEQLDYQPGP